MTQDVAAARVDLERVQTFADNMAKKATDTVMIGDVVVPVQSIRALLARVAALEDSNEGLTADLRMAVQTAYNRGATEWARLNYPQWIDWLDSQKGGGA